MSDLKLSRVLLDLFLAGKDCGLRSPDVQIEILDSPEMEHADLVQVILDQVHLADELRDQLDQRI